METVWTNTELFQWTVVGSSLAALGSYLLSSEPFTVRRCIGTVFFHGPVGASIGVACYESKKVGQWTALAIGVLYAAGVVHIDMLRKILLRAIGGSLGETGSNNNGNPDEKK